MSGQQSRAGADARSSKREPEEDGVEWFPLARAVLGTVWELLFGSSSSTCSGSDADSMAVPTARCAARWLVVGLGNHGMPGTRHSVGAEAVAYVASELGLRWSPDRDCKGTVATGRTDAGADLILLRPKLLMNVNGRSVAAAARYVILHLLRACSSRAVRVPCHF